MLVKKCVSAPIYIINTNLKNCQQDYIFLLMFK